MADGLMGWLLRRLRPARGWLLMALAIATALLLPLALESAGWMRAPDGLWLLAMGAVVTGVWLAGRRWRWGFSVLVALGIGVLLTVQWVQPFLPSPGRVWAEVGAMQRWLAGAPAAQVPWFGLVRDVAWQFGGTLGGDRVLLLRLVVAVLVGGSSFWLGWWLFRGPGVHPWRAVLPAGLLLVLNAFFGVGQDYFVAVFLLLALALVAWGRWHQQEVDWAQRRTDYPSDLGLDHGTAAAVLGAAALVVVLVVPQIVVSPAVDWFWGLVREPWAQVEARVELLFPGMLRGSGGSLLSGSGQAGLPRVYLLGSGPELAEREVFRVATNTPERMPAPRWRELTYTIYTGRGWQLEDASALDESTVPAGRTWLPASETTWGGGVRFEQRIERVQSPARLVVSAGAADAVSVDYRAVLRAPGDAVALEMRSPQWRYTVYGQAATDLEQKLRIVNYSTNPNQIYLKLPNDVPKRIRALAAEIVAPASTPYEQARLLEAYLRTLTYDLDVPRVGEDRDLVDAFLFDIRRGYCDYFASAFVVMARSVGLPARLAVGYASGTEVSPGQWVVTEADAHSWPEVFFDGVGWVPFEPTPSQPVSDFSALTGDSADVLTPPRTAWAALPSGVALAIVLALAAVGVLGWLLLRTWRTPQNAADIFARVAHWGKRLGQSPRPGDTVRTYGAALTTRVTETSRVGTANRLNQLILALLAWCEATLYAPAGERPPPVVRHRLWRQWQRSAALRVEVLLRRWLDNRRQV